LEIIKIKKFNFFIILIILKLSNNTNLEIIETKSVLEIYVIKSK